MIWYFPLIPAETRYTGYLDRMIAQQLGADEVTRLGPLTLGSKPRAGDFFDAAAEIAFRSDQITEFAFRSRNEYDPANDVIWMSDLFLPGVEMIAYMCALAGHPKPRIRGLIHAGSYGEYDLMHGEEYWASQHETAVLALIDEAYIGSEYHKQDILAKRICDPNKLVVTGHLIDDKLPERYTGPRENLVVFNSRLSAEKQPWLFRKLASEMHGEAEFVISLDAVGSKEAYYDLLNSAKVVVSFALHETYGVAIQEAIQLGCVPVVPDRLCYAEQVPDEYRYVDFHEVQDLVRAGLVGLLPPLPAREQSQQAIIERWFD